MNTLQRTCLLAAAMIAMSGSVWADATKGPITFNKDVLPVLQANCQQCHRPDGDNIAGMVAPMSLMTYAEARPWAKAIAKAVESNSMPPWFTTHEFSGIFRNERVLTSQESSTLINWAATGAKRGRPEDAPAPLVFEENGGWFAGTPDLIVTMPEPYFVSDDLEDQYVSFVSEPIREEQMAQDSWLRTIEYRGDSEVVHHIVGSYNLKDENGVMQRHELGSIAPGEEGTSYPDGYGKLLPAGVTINFSMHYHKEPGAGTGVWDQSMVGFGFWDEDAAPVTHAVKREGITNHNFEIPPGHAAWEVGAAKTFEKDTTILALHPHMHLRGKDARYVAIYPDGTRETLLDVPNFDFNWQLDYSYDILKKIPAGTRVEFTARYDNSPENIYNPDHTIPMIWGGPTTMEMMIGYIAYADTDPDSTVQSRNND